MLVYLTSANEFNVVAGLNLRRYVEVSSQDEAVPASSMANSVTPNTQTFRKLIVHDVLAACGCTPVTFVCSKFSASIWKPRGGFVLMTVHDQSATALDAQHVLAVAVCLQHYIIGKQHVGAPQVSLAPRASASILTA